ncbi:bifunctional diaminohydroxyphosphoribosylaminopyrimidine deaminase/5-amino-6-(5-phosphoribosylamino)uracil reductase RibD [Thiomicrorhabdus sp. Milos-T2]|uniref:bifunctional diaminohydroxyphosphoribosylaminopyrimidine deaminase/5-amino-6-(5-phosphoribosylamino)uracil reductase RibD n=1 Tax=Thiomicrorhabdus sp. Milos-T2 TaxID=90814 RepID=UPI000494CB5B|nr:bifunctional diaminohydroxyphosphoribosylaminopyrimidine deaminase/5-amino-6-(5-phosphoribosylamino)uracil reductase RibD [Thiomicrorhabdus sp. Milos-T2]
MSLVSSADLLYMQQAIDLAKKGLYSTKPNPAVGCVLVKDGVVVGEGWHQKAGQPHAERVALANAGDKAKGATAYVTLEPCSHFGRTPPCADGLIEAQVSRVVVAMQDPNPMVSGQGIERIRKAGIEVLVGVLEAEAKQINLGFIRKMEKQLPFVRLKMASSLDGRTAMENGESYWITGEESRLEVHRMRARCGALITGIGTVLADNPSLTVRLTDNELAKLNLNQDNCHPIRVVLDPHLSMPLDAKMLSLPGRTILMTSLETVERSSEIVDAIHAKGVEIVAVSAENDRLDIESILRYLAEAEQINDVMVESGAIVAGAFILSGLVNEIHSFIAPSLMGNMAKPMFVLPGLETMDDKINLSIQSMDRFGEDARIILVPKQTTLI